MRNQQGQTPAQHHRWIKKIPSDSNISMKDIHLSAKRTAREDVEGKGKGLTVVTGTSGFNRLHLKHVKSLSEREQY